MARCFLLSMVLSALVGCQSLNHKYAAVNSTDVVSLPASVVVVHGGASFPHEPQSWAQHYGENHFAKLTCDVSPKNRQARCLLTIHEPAMERTFPLWLEEIGCRHVSGDFLVFGRLSEGQLKVVVDVVDSEQTKSLTQDESTWLIGASVSYSLENDQLVPYEETVTLLEGGRLKDVTRQFKFKDGRLME